MRLLFAAIAALTLFAGCKAAEEKPAPVMAEAAEAPPAWTTIAPGGDTLCATGTPYSFHVRGGDASRVMIFLNGGGACWSGDLCDPALGANAYTPFAEMDANTAGTKGGAFDSANPENPFAGWTQVFVSYCTGDAHLGARDATYTTSTGKELTIHHRGKANVQSALDWVYANYPAPSRVFVGGGSAGAIASPFYAGVVADHYPQAEIVQYGGGAGGYRAGAVSGLLEAWGTFASMPDWPELAAFDRAAFTTEDFFRVTAARHPDMRMHQFNNVDDEVQQMFLGLMGATDPVRGLLQANLDELAAEIPNFRSYSASGKDHTLLRYDRLYTTETGGVRAVDWVRGLAGGRDVQSVSCLDEGCD
ncbi:pectin acetylesterase-family hydrolase [Hyphomonas sp.]|uniref:pectin acetylesterase-family hydrolase n=1 Tax=Hyphomonas sp. TaxID=87 RepID=UPI003918DA00